MPGKPYDDGQEESKKPKKPKKPGFLRRLFGRKKGREGKELAPASETPWDLVQKEKYDKSRPKTNSSFQILVADNGCLCIDFEDAETQKYFFAAFAKAKFNISKNTDTFRNYRQGFAIMFDDQDQLKAEFLAGKNIIKGSKADTFPFIAHLVDKGIEYKKDSTSSSISIPALFNGKRVCLVGRGQEHEPVPFEAVVTSDMIKNVARLLADRWISSDAAEPSQPQAAAAAAPAPIPEAFKTLQLEGQKNVTFRWSAAGNAVASLVVQGQVVGIKGRESLGSDYGIPLVEVNPLNPNVPKQRNTGYITSTTKPNGEVSDYLPGVYITRAGEVAIKFEYEHLKTQFAQDFGLEAASCNHKGDNRILVIKKQALDYTKEGAKLETRYNGDLSRGSSRA